MARAPWVTSPATESTNADTELGHSRGGAADSRGIPAPRLTDLPPNPSRGWRPRGSLGETTMRLSPLLCLTMALCMVSLFPGASGLSINTSRFTVEMELLPEGRQKLSTAARRIASVLTSSIGLRRPCGWARFRTDVVPQDQKEASPVAESMDAKRPVSTGLRNLLSWLRFRTHVGPQDPKQPPTGAKRIPCKSMGLLCIACIVLHFWRNGERLQQQGTGQKASSSTGTACRGKNTICKKRLLCRMQADIAQLLRCRSLVRRLLLKEIRHRYYEKAAREAESRSLRNPS